MNAQDIKNNEDLETAQWDPEDLEDQRAEAECSKAVWDNESPTIPSDGILERYLTLAFPTLEQPITIDDLIYHLTQVHAELKETDEEGLRLIQFSAEVKKVSSRLAPLVGMVFNPESGEIVRMKHLTIPPGSPLEDLLEEAFPDLKVRPIPITHLRACLEQCGASLNEHSLPGINSLLMIVFGYETNRLYPTLSRLRGLIFDSVTGEIFSLTYPVPVEYKNLTLNEKEQLGSNPMITKKSYVVQEALDGTLLRLWFHPKLQRWFVSTNGTINAFEATWGTGNKATFGDLFQPYLEEILTRCVLDTNLVYLFIVCHPNNIVVVNHQQPKVYHVATIDLNTLQEIVDDIPTPLITSISVDTFLTYPQILELAKREDQANGPVQSAGFVITSYPDKKGLIRRIRIENQNYIDARNLRGNSADIRNTLLELMLKHPADDLVRFLMYFPMYVGEHQRLAQNLKSWYGFMIKTFASRYHLRNYVELPPKQHAFLKTIYETERKISDEIITQHLTILPMDELNFLLM